jgi:hypothetical protein
MKTVVISEIMDITAVFFIGQGINQEDFTCSTNVDDVLSFAKEYTGNDMGGSSAGIIQSGDGCRDHSTG